MDCLLFALTFLCALGAGLIGGLFFAFSTFVMTALGRLSPASGISAMQSINVAVLNPVFFTAFFGKQYLSTWTAWNHVRTIASLVAAASFIMALVRLPN